MIHKPFIEGTENVTTTTKPPLTKLTVNLLPQARQALFDAAAGNEHTKTDTVNRALQVYAAVTEHCVSGGQILFVTPRTDFWGRVLRLKRIESVLFTSPSEPAESA